MSASKSDERTRQQAHSTLSCRSTPRRECLQCCVSGRSRSAFELTVSAAFRSFRHPGDCSTNDRSQGTADIAGRQLAATLAPGRRLNRGRHHPASNADRMSAGQGLQLALPTQLRHCNSRIDRREADLTLAGIGIGIGTGTGTGPDGMRALCGPAEGDFFASKSGHTDRTACGPSASGGGYLRERQQADGAMSAVRFLP
jgi:hypothetical protein